VALVGVQRVESLFGDLDMTETTAGNLRPTYRPRNPNEPFRTHRYGKVVRLVANVSSDGSIFLGAYPQRTRRKAGGGTSFLSTVGVDELRSSSALLETWPPSWREEAQPMLVSIAIDVAWWLGVTS
jgi:hypothetical protein